MSTARLARQSPFLGLWWRWNARMSGLGGGKQIIVLVGSYLAFRVIDFAVGDLGRLDAAAAAQYLWLGICAYTWIAPGIFVRMLKREREGVKLRKSF